MRGPGAMAGGSGGGAAGPETANNASSAASSVVGAVLVGAGAGAEYVYSSLTGSYLPPDTAFFAGFAAFSISTLFV